MNLKTNWKLVLSGILLISSGFIGGVIVQERATKGRINKILNNQQSFLIRYFLERMDAELGLSPDPKSKISKTFADAIKKIDEIRESSSKSSRTGDFPDKEIGEILKKMSEKIRDDLLPDQKPKFEQLEKILFPWKSR